MEERTQPSQRPTMDIIPPKTNSPMPIQVNTEPAKPEVSTASTNQVSSAPKQAEFMGVTQRPQSTENTIPLTAEPEPAIVDVPVVRPVQPSSDLTPKPFSAAIATEAFPPQPDPVRADATDKELDHIIGEVDAHKKSTTPKSQKPVLIAIIALVVAVGLAVVAYMAFKNTSSADKAAPQTSQNTTTNTQKIVDTAVTADELNTFSQSVDKQINGMNETQDFGASDISDQSLGLQ